MTDQQIAEPHPACGGVTAARGFRATGVHAGFRKVVFAVMIMLVVLFFSKGIMGNRELSWDGIARFFGRKTAG